jgi:putative ABC transport system ATP-binding protein
MSILEIKNLNYGYNDGEKKRVILNDLSYQFERGKMYTILGPSGSGKTTFLSIASALDKPQKGAVLYEGKDIKEIGYHKFRRNHMSIVFQSYNLVNYLTAVENVMVAMDNTDNEAPKNKKDVAYNLLDYLGIVKTKANRLVDKLSGGEQQRVAIARALSTNVDVIFADEPTGNLDNKTENEIISIFRNLTGEYNKCVIIVTHSLEVAKKSDVILQLSNGKLNEVKIEDIVGGE